MGADQNTITGPDLREGLLLSSLKAEEKILGHVEGEPVLLIKRGERFFAIGAQCSHYSGPLNEGIITDGTVHCPWHHACFDLETGEALKAPALNPIPTWRTEVRADKVFVLEKRAPKDPKPEQLNKSRFVIVGSGAAGHAAAERLRHLGYQGHLILLSEDSDPPYDRPNLSKDYLAGEAQPEWMPLRPPEYYDEHKIELRLGVQVSALDTQKKNLRLSSGEEIAFEKCLLATGGSPIRPKIEGLDLSHVHFLRSFSDCRKLIHDLETDKKVLIVGAGFIGLEAAASIRARGCEVTVAAPQGTPLEKVVGSQFGLFLKALHEKNGVHFHLNDAVTKIHKDRVEFKSGSQEPADVVLVATGISPNVSLAQRAGLSCDDGILVNEFLETSSPDIYAAGDVARWPQIKGSTLRVEHWVVAQRLGQTAAENMLGKKEKFREVPFFWSQQFGLSFRYVGHSKNWDRSEVFGSLEEKNGSIAYYEGDRIAAVLTLGRDQQSLEIEQALHAQDQETLRKILKGSR